LFLRKGFQLKRSVFILILLLMATVSATAQRSKRTAKRAPQKTASQPLPDPTELAKAASAARSSLLIATQNYLSSLEKLRDIYLEEEQRASEGLEKHQQLLSLGVIARREVDESETKLAEAQKKSLEVQKQIGEAHQLMAEVAIAEEDAKKPKHFPVQMPGTIRSTLVYIRYAGTPYWSLNDAGKVSAFFENKFGRVLPISAYGQSPTHDRLGFDHRHSMDVAVHPDSAEGRALMAYLQSQGIPYTAFRAPLAGNATGAHIHIGLPSRRLAPSY
jgi:hypothetical protein